MALTKTNPTITIEDGAVQPCQEPVVVSASRSTDIPAFYCDWFFHRLKVGYSVWTNPFNGVKMYVSYAKTRFIVFWSKNPRPLLDHLDELAERGIKCYVQYSLNDYEAEKLEKNVRPLAERIETFKLLVERLGFGGVIWRFDPLMLTEDIDIDKLLKKIENIGDQLKGYTEKQWGRDCKELPAFIIKRLPVRLTFDNNYFNALYQGIPVGGYTQMVANMLEGIEVRLGVDYFDNKAEFDAMAEKVVYTGPIDAYFNFSLGTLEYRSVRFENEILDYLKKIS